MHTTQRTCNLCAGVRACVCRGDPSRTCCNTTRRPRRRRPLIKYHARKTLLHADDSCRRRPRARLRPLRDVNVAAFCTDPSRPTTIVHRRLHCDRRHVTL